MDGTHVPGLHHHHSGDQFIGIKTVEPVGNEPPPYGRVREIAPTTVAERTALGVKRRFPMRDRAAWYWIIVTKRLYQTTLHS